MAARAIWKGIITFGEVRVPVKLYSAAQDRTVRFRLLHAKDRTPVQQRMVNPLTDEVVPAEEIRKGFEIDDGRYVVLDPDELESVEPEPSRDIEVTRFIEPDAVEQAWYDRPYYLGPDEAEKAYFALHAALERKRRIGIARWVMRRKDYVGALRSDGRHLMLITLRRAGEVIPVTALDAPEGRALDRREVAMAEQLVGALADRFDPTEFRDEFRDRVLELIETKARGGKIELKRVERRPPARSLTKALEASIEAARERRRAA